MYLSYIARTDPEIAGIIAEDMQRQENTLELIASENVVSPAVLAAQGSVLTNKYAEGYPGKRYYGGCKYVDEVERLAIERARQVFQADCANLQPHSGSQANMAVYHALLDPGDTVLGMDLAHGGHLTHGSAASFSGRHYNFVHYGVRQETGMIDYDEVAAIAGKHRPKLIVAGASAYPRIIDFEAFARIAQSIDAYFMVDMAHIAGLVAAGVHPSPVPHADVVSSTTHKTLRGPRGGLILSKAAFGDRIDKAIFPGIQGGPFMHTIAAKAVALHEAMDASFRIYQEKTVHNAEVLADSLLQGGINLVSGGTDTHLMLLDLRNLNISGKDAEGLLGRAGITVNKNTIPFDPQSPFVTSGIRIGTPLATTRGMGAPEMILIAGWIVALLQNPGNENLIEQIRRETLGLCQKFSLAQHLDSKPHN